MKKFFADATFAADGKLNHTLDGEAKVKNYTLNGNNLVFNLYEGSDTYKVNATSFPDEDGDRLFISSDRSTRERVHGHLRDLYCDPLTQQEVRGGYLSNL